MRGRCSTPGLLSVADVDSQYASHLRRDQQRHRELGARQEPFELEGAPCQLGCSKKGQPQSVSFLQREMQKMKTNSI